MFLAAVCAESPGAYWKMTGLQRRCAYLNGTNQKRALVRNRDKLLSAKQLTQKLATSRSAVELEKIWRLLSSSPCMDRLHLVTLLHRCGALSLSLSVAMPWLDEVAIRLIEQIPRRQIPNFLAIHRHEHKSTSAPSRMSPREVASVLWAMGRLRPGRYHATLITLTDITRRQLLEDLNLPRVNGIPFKPQELANAVWALASLATPNSSNSLTPAATQTLEISCAQLTNDMGSQEMANISWAFATLRACGSTWFPTVATKLDPASMVASEPRHLVNLLWAFARAECRHQSFHHALGDVLVQRSDLQAWTPHDLAGAAWSLASLEVLHTGAFRRISAEAQTCGRLRTFKPQELQNIAWAFAIVAQEKIGCSSRS